MDEEDRRHESAKRLDAFVDAAFAFAVTLLLISGVQPPGNLEELKVALLRIPASAAAFALIVLFWNGHRRFGRLTHARDGRVTLVSLVIVFTVLVYVFPLRLLMESGFFYFSGGRLPGAGLVRSFAELRDLYVIYGIGFTVLTALYGALFGQGVRLAETPEVRARARMQRDSWLIASAMGVVSAILAFAAPLDRVPWLPPFAYSAIPLLIWAWNRRRGERAAKPAPKPADSVPSPPR